MGTNIADKVIKPGFYSVELNRTVWIVPKYYQDLTPVGTGAYGTVWFNLNLISNLLHLGYVIYSFYNFNIYIVWCKKLFQIIFYIFFWILNINFKYFKKKS